MKSLKMINLIYVIIKFIMVIIVFIMPFVFGISIILLCPVTANGNTEYAVLQFIFGVIFLVVYVKVIRACGEYNVHECCELQDSLESIQTALSKQKNLREKKNIDLRIEKLSVLNALGYFEEELEEIERLKLEIYIMTDSQRVKFEMEYLRYLAVTGKDTAEQMEQVRIQLKNADIWDRFFYGTRQLKGYEYFVNGEWEKFLEWTEQFDRRTTLEQVSYAYERGICYFHLGRFSEAEGELAFAKKWGGDTRYVSGAGELLEKLPDQVSRGEEKQPLRTEKKKAIRKNYRIMILMAVIFIFSNFFHPHCSSLETAYRIKNHINLSRPVHVLYEQKTDDCGIAYIFNGRQVAYCVVDYRKSDKGTKYKVEKMPCFYGLKSLSYENSGFSIESIDFFVESDIEWLIEYFYEGDDSLAENNVPAIGVYCDPVIEDVTINGQALEILDRKEIGKNTFYIWQAESINYTVWPWLDLDVKVERD